MLDTPTKSTVSVRSRLTTPITHPSSLDNQHAFATPAFLRPTAQPIQSPQSPSLPWERIPRKIKGLSALISDFRANQQETVEEMDHEAWEDNDELKITLQGNSPGVAGRKPWTKKGAKRSKRRVISIQF
jgi:DNA replication and checkpoint protein